MPMYDYRCSVCGHGKTVFQRIAELDVIPVLCSACNFAMNRKISAPAIIKDYAGYSCPVTGNWIEGRKAHAENLAKHDCRLLEPGEREAVIKARADDEARLDAAIEDTTERFIAGLPTEKRDRLAAEMENGLDVTIERRTA